MEEKKLTDDDMLSKVTDWLRTKAKTDGDMYYVGVIVGEFLVAKRQKEEIDILRGEIERLKEMCSKSSFKDSWKNKFFKAQEEIERLTEERQTLVTKYNQTDEAVDYWCEKYKQAVKDAAKEIFTRLAKRRNQGIDGGGFFVEYTLRLEDLNWFEEKYGVEVE